MTTALVVNDLSFAELRLANLVHPHVAQLMSPTNPLMQLDDTTLAQALAEMVIQADWLAASKNIDLVQAIRNSFAAGAKPPFVIGE